MNIHKILALAIITTSCLNPFYSEFHTPIGQSQESLFIIHINSYDIEFDIFTLNGPANNQITMGNLSRKQPLYTNKYKTESEMFGDIFFRDQIATGTYTPLHLHSNEGTGNNMDGTTYMLKDNSELKFTATNSSVYFLGSYQVFTLHDRRVPRKYLEKIERPTEEEVLQKFLLKARGSFWEPKIEARLQELEINQALQIQTPTSASLPTK